MTSAAQEQSRAARLKEFDAELSAARRAGDVMGSVVRGREAREWDSADPAEVVFAASGEARLTAAVWVALRSDDTGSVVEALTTASERRFVVSEREEMGEGYRLQKVEEALPLPDVDLLFAQLAAMLAIPADVLGMLAQWGPDDPRTAVEISALLDSRFAAAGPPAAKPEPPVGAEPARAARAMPARAGSALTMSVQETADVLQLSAAQTKVLQTLVRRAGVTITP